MKIVLSTASLPFHAGSENHFQRPAAGFDKGWLDARWVFAMIDKHLLPLSIGIALCVGACTKKDMASQPPNTGAAAPMQHAHEGGDHDHEFEPAIQSYHDTMAPYWHADAGEQRKTDTCNAAPEFIAKAEAIRAGNAPSGEADITAWEANADALVAASKSLQAVCEAENGDFDASFKSVHEAFHALTEHDEPE